LFAVIVDLNASSFSCIALLKVFPAHMLEPLGAAGAALLAAQRIETFGQTMPDQRDHLAVANSAL